MGDEDRTELLERTRKGIGLLVLLSLSRGAAYESLYLQEILWPDSDDPKKRGGNYRTQVSRLRKALGDSKKALITGRQGVRLDTNYVSSDLATFLDCLARSDWHGAVVAYTGPLLPGEGDQWAEEEREKLRTRFLAAIAALVEQQAPEAALETIERWHREAPESEEPYRQRWRCLVMLNRQQQALSEALDYFEQDPNREPETKLWLDRLHKVRRRKELPPLPTPWTRFIGREKELSLLVGQVRGERLFTLCGEGGMGKTRLALELAHRLYGTFEQQVAFIDLSRLPADAEAPAIWALLEQVLSEPMGSIPELRALLVIDNAEHVLAAVKEVVLELLDKGAELQLLLTSRQELGYWRERKRRIGGLLLRDARTLFLQVSPVIENLENPEESTALDNLCTRLDRWPLAIELTASRREAFQSLKALEQNLEQALVEAGASAGDPTVSDRERTLNTTLDWSARLLSEQVRFIWHACPSFVGGVSLEALAGVMVLPVDTVQAALEHLATASLLRKEGERYRVLEPIRAYLKPKQTTQEAFANYFLHLAESQPGDATLEAERANMVAAGEWLVDHAPDDAMRLGAALWRFWWIHGSQTNGFAFLRRALAMAGEHALRTEVLIGAGALAYGIRDLEAEELGREAQERAHTIGDILLEARAWLNWGLAALIRDENDVGSERFRHAEELFTHANSERGVRLARANQVLAMVRAGNTDQVILLYQTSLKEFEANGEVDGWLTEALNFAFTLSRLGNRELRIPLVIEVLKRASQHAHLGTLARGFQACLELLPSLEAAVLWGALDQFRLDWGIPLSPDLVGKDQIERWKHEAILGNEAWQAARDLGASLSLEEVINRIIRILKNL
ncbi:MAG: BTAD domain-containing putative transcriptional regulator [Armatimonas sp.]